MFERGVVSGGSIVPTLFIDIGDGQGPVNQGPTGDVKEFFLSTGKGSDEVSIHDLTLSLGLAVATGDGADKLTVGPNVETDELFEIDTGAGDDVVVLGLEVSVNTGSAEVRTRAGSDTVYTIAALPMEIYGLYAAGDIKIYGGGGQGDDNNDRIDITQGSIYAYGNVSLGGFESFGAALSEEQLNAIPDLLTEP